MTIKIADGGSWKTIKAIRFPFPDVEDQVATPRNWVSPYGPPVTGRQWNNPTRLWVSNSGRWINTGYVPVASPPGEPFLVSGTPYSVTVSWNPSTADPLPTVYTANLYTQAGVKVASASLLQTDFTNRTLLISRFGFSRPSVTFGDLPAALPQTTIFPPSPLFRLTPDTNYYVTVTASGPGMNPKTSGQLRIRTGHAQETKQVAVYDWVDETDPIHPVLSAATSAYSGFPASNTVDRGLPGTSGVLAPFSSGWVSKDRGKQSSTTKPNDLWEGLFYTMPTGDRRRLKSVQVVADEPHNVYLGVLAGGVWKGALTPANLGIASTTYLANLQHNFLRANTDHSTIVKLFNVLDQDLEFSEIGRLDLAINNFINLFGTPATSGTWTPGTQTQVTLPPYGAMVVDSTRKKVYYTPSQYTVTTGFFKDPDTGVAYVATPSPPAGAIWPNGATSGNYDYAVTSGLLHFRPLTAGGSLMAYADGCTFLRKNGLTSVNGTVIGLTKEQVFTPALLGTTSTPPTYVNGVPASPAWRARVLDVSLFYQSWKPTGRYTTIVTVPAAATVAGPTVW